VSSEEIQQSTTLHCPHNIETCVISDITTAPKTLELGNDLVFDIEYLGDEVEAYTPCNHSN